MRRLLPVLAVSLALGALGAGRALADGPESIEDPDYRFRLVRPGPEWTLLREEDAQRLVPLAVAGMSSTSGAYGVVIVEETGGIELESYAKVLLDGQPLEDKEVVAFRDTKLHGLSAIEYQTTGVVHGIPVRYRCVVLQHQGFGYQLIAWKIRSSEGDDAEELRAVAESFSVLNGTVRGRAATKVAPDTVGVGWRVKDGTYESAAYRFSLRPAAGWRLALGNELVNMYRDAEVGLVRTHPEAYLTVVVERAAGVDPAAHEERLHATFAEMLGAPGEAGTTTVRVDGRDLVFRRHAVTTGLPREFLHAVHFEGDLVFQLVAWFLAPLRERAEPEVLRALAGFEFLEGHRASEVSDALASAPDSQNRVGPDWSIRGGVFRDFRNGLTWRAPAGWWRITAGSGARALEPEASLVVEEPSLGLVGVVRCTPAAGRDPEAFHREMVEALFGDTDAVGQPEPLGLGDARAWTTSGRERPEEGTRKVRLATVVHEGTAADIRISGTPTNLKYAARRVEEALAGFRFPAGGLPASRRTEDEYRDERVGYALRRPAEGWEFDDRTPSEISALGSVIRWRSAARQAFAGGVCTIDESNDLSIPLGMIGAIVREATGQDVPGPDDAEATLGGRSARRFSWRQPFAADAWLTQRDRTWYWVVVVGEGEGPTSDEVAGGFTLVD